MNQPLWLQKALKYDEKKHLKSLNGRWIEEKLDGVGAQVVFNIEENVRIYGMTKAAVSGEFSDWTNKLPHLVKELENLQYYASIDDSEWTGIIQGELIVDYFTGPNENFGFVTGTLHADDAVERQQEYKLKFVAYELPSSGKIYKERYAELQRLFEPDIFKYISLNPIMAVNGPDNYELERCFNAITGAGREGVVLYDSNCLYKLPKPRAKQTNQRNPGLLKIKAEGEVEVLCIEMVEGKDTDKGGKFVGTLGAMICQDSEGRVFNIGSFNITNAERDRIWNEMKVPFLIEMSYFEKTATSYKLPRFKRVRSDKDTKDWNKADSTIIDYAPKNLMQTTLF